MRAILSWFVLGWQQLALGLALVVGLSGWAYVQGRADGGNAILAAEAKGNAQALEIFKGQTKTVIADATKDAFADFNAKLGVMGTVAKQLSTQQEIAHANVVTLSDAMRGRFSLSPSERLRFECIRRPADPRCVSASPADATVRSAVPQ